MYDQIGRALDTQNYINHPPTFYWLLALVQRIAPLAPAHQVWYRLLPLTGFGLAIVAYWLTQRLLKSSEFSAHAFMTVPLGLMVWATAPFVNNDMFGLLGGAIAVWGTVVLVGTNRSGGSILMATGLALASAKLNEFILVAIYCATVVWFVRKQKPAEARQIIIVGLFYIGLLLLPYLALFVTYGSPAPNTPGQSQTLHELALAQGLAATPRLSFPAYILRSLPDFLNAMGGGILFALTSTLVAAGLISGFIPSREQGGVEAVVARSAALATGATLILHLTVSYRTHQAYGVLLDMYPRYYFPLTSAYAIAAALAVGRFVGWWQLKGGPAANDMLPFMVRVAATLTSRPRC